MRVSTTRAIALACTSMLIAACSDIERSRNVNNPDVPATTVAQQVCAMCHGVTGVSVSPTFPKLAGQQREYLVAQLSEFKSHSRSDPTGAKFMWGFTHLNEAQVQGLADYFSSQKPSYGPAGDVKLTEEGRRIFTEGIPDRNVPMCSACHGQQGEGNGQFPRLAGQHADYVVKQLMVFQRTDQRPRGGAMKVVTHDLSEHEMHALATFVQSFQPAAQ
ncbi:MAG TPA: c-type cytochrome [Methylibium sp.]